MNRAELKNKAKQLIKGKLFTLFLIMIIVVAAEGLISAVFSRGQGGVTIGDDGAVNGQIGFGTGVMGLATLLITGAISLTWAIIYLGIAKKNREPKVEDVKLGFVDGNYSRAFEAGVRYSLFTFLWSLLFVIPGIIKSIEYSQMFFLMADNPKMSAGDAQKKSMEIMNGHKMEYFVLQLSFFGWYILTGLTFGIAAVYVVPYVQTTTALYYRALVEKKK